MARFRRYGRRRYYRRSRFGGRRFGRRFSRRRYGRRRSRSTRSSPVKMTLEADFNPFASTSTAVAFSFAPSSFSGFSQYFPVYSEFRILMARIYIHRTKEASELPESYMVVSSGPFADSQPPVSVSGESVQAATLPSPKSEEELRQARWQRLIYPSTIRTATKVRFRPYTFLLSGGPVALASTGTVDTSLSWMKRYDARRWMPMQWANGRSRQTDLAFYGPYIWPNLPSGGIAPSQQRTLRITLECFFQFRGQV